MVVIERGGFINYYSLEPTEVVEIIKTYINCSNKEFSDTEISDLVSEHLLSKANLIEKQQAHVFDSLHMLLLRAYHRGIKDFKSMLDDIHTLNEDRLKKDISISEYSKYSILNDMLSEQRINNLEIQKLAALVSLKRLYSSLISEIELGHFYFSQFEGYIQTYANILFDVDVLLGGSFRRNQKIANLELFQLAKNMLNYDFNHQMPVVESSIFLIRQAIEVQIKESFGITGRKKNSQGDNRESYLKISQLLDFLITEVKNNKLAIFINPILLKKINKWLNNYIHTGSMNYPFWYIEWIQNYLNDFFYPSKYLKEIDNSLGVDFKKPIFVDKNCLNDFEKRLTKVEQKDTLILNTLSLLELDTKIIKKINHKAKKLKDEKLKI
ncbi:hypothetical protein PTI45_03145 [Paenibacillus nuruki]|uniref:Uncharacterized protein n=1 Tax=Paenibacillus nuruki TaxID=1886670 RepID=A0A1E3L2P0_9BACL|nr:hypothetical protein [Paenibacillus nuruki]ODP27435.1 hypothetical protein PTI45_03145 [Paenibacillus nuruki]